MRLRPLSSTLRDRRGTAAIEFAMIAPLLVAMIVAAVELGFMTRARILAQEAASAGALYASQHSYNAAGITGIKSAVTNASTETTITVPAGTPSEAWGCPTATGIVASTQGATCTDGKSARHYITVSASVPRTSILASSFGLPANVVATSIVRLP